MFVIINWSSYDDIELVRNENGSVKLFKTETETTKYAETELNFLWKIAEV